MRGMFPTSAGLNVGAGVKAESDQPGSRHNVI